MATTQSRYLCQSSTSWCSGCARPSSHIVPIEHHDYLPRSIKAESSGPGIDSYSTHCMFRRVLEDFFCSLRLFAKLSWLLLKSSRLSNLDQLPKATEPLEIYTLHLRRVPVVYKNVVQIESWTESSNEVLE